MKTEQIQKTQKKIDTKKIVVTGVFSAVAYVLMILDFNVPLMPGFIKLDFSDLPELIASLLLGPVSGVTVCLIKNLLHLLISQSFGIGELSNFLIGCAFVIPAGLIYKHKKSFSGAVIGSLVGVVSMAFICVLSNYFIVYPLYIAVLNFSTESILGMYQTVLPSVNDLFSALIIFNLPFTFVKGLANSLIALALYKRISQVISL